ncbi:MAG: Glu/Leu/Phe/Val dehydrogenase [Kiloniellaceae bacterium]
MDNGVEGARGRQIARKGRAIEDVFRFADELGPAKIVEIYEPGVGLKAIVVVDNVACGPAIGGVRMASDVSVEECFRLARAMTLKNAAAGLAHGGGKSVIFADPRMPVSDKERLIRAFACAIGDIKDYIPGPDMGTDEGCMAWIVDEIGRAVGLPREFGGIPLDEIGATGFGLGIAVDVAQRYCGMTLKGARMAVQGFGSVGQHAARFLGQKGAVLVAAADSRGTLHDPAGIDIEALSALKAKGGSVIDCPTGEKMGRDAVADIACEIWIPAARPDAIHADNVDGLKARLVAQGANIAVTADAEAALHARGVLSLPDFIANAGGVICAAVEYHGGSETQAFETIEEKIRRNTELVLQEAKKTAQPPRRAAVALAERRVRRAMAHRRWSSSTRLDARHAAGRPSRGRLPP